VNVPPSSNVGERLAALAGQRPWWPLVEPTPRWIRVRIGHELVADSRRALLHVKYGRGALPRSSCRPTTSRWTTSCPPHSSTPWRPRPG